ncbi:MAG: hypothetical protein MK110_04340 [Fuerstiella sp.]|nr:hypothetical protein [Fuerstiella sp.]
MRSPGDYLYGRVSPQMFADSRTYQLPDEMQPMTELLNAIKELLSEHWIKVLTAAGFTLAGWIVAHWRASRAWKRREFFERINFSLNSITDDTLRIRTLSEKSCSDIFLNTYAVRRLGQLIAKTNSRDPVVPIPRKDCWFFLNSVLNELSEQFASGLLAREAGKQVLSTQYLICLTNECDGDLRTRKLRAMVIRRKLLLCLPEAAPKFEHPQHRIRWQTLKHLQKRYTSEPWRFLEVELVV